MSEKVQYVRRDRATGAEQLAYRARPKRTPTAVRIQAAQAYVAGERAETIAARLGIDHPQYIASWARNFLAIGLIAAPDNYRRNNWVTRHTNKNATEEPKPSQVPTNWLNKQATPRVSTKSVTTPAPVLALISRIKTLVAEVEIALQEGGGKG